MVEENWQREIYLEKPSGLCGVRGLDYDKNPHRRTDLLKAGNSSNRR
jgi:hypothetical protein